MWHFRCVQRTTTKYTTGCWSDEEGWRKVQPRGRLLALRGVSREAKGDRPVRYAMCEITITPNALPSTQLGFGLLYIRTKYPGCFGIRVNSEHVTL